MNLRLGRGVNKDGRPTFSILRGRYDGFSGTENGKRNMTTNQYKVTEKGYVITVSRPQQFKVTGTLMLTKFGDLMSGMVT